MDRIIQFFAPTSRADFVMRFVAIEALIHALNLGLWAVAPTPVGFDRFWGTIICAVVSVPFVILMLLMLQHLVALKQGLLRLAGTDGLTGLPNRRAFIAAVGGDTGETVVADGILMLIDADHFKRINDSMGHAMGDRCLIAIAERLRHAVRPGDAVARMGGEEFALFLPGAPRAAVDALGQRLTAALTVRDIESGDAARFTVSVGATPVAKGDGLADAISRADAALYRAKEAGRARMIFDSGLRAA